MPHGSVLACSHSVRSRRARVPRRCPSRTPLLTTLAWLLPSARCSLLVHRRSPCSLGARRAAWSCALLALTPLLRTSVPTPREHKCPATAVPRRVHDPRPNRRGRATAGLTRHVCVPAFPSSPCPVRGRLSLQRRCPSLPPRAAQPPGLRRCSVSRGRAGALPRRQRLSCVHAVARCSRRPSVGPQQQRCPSALPRTTTSPAVVPCSHVAVCRRGRRGDVLQCPTGPPLLLCLKRVNEG